MEIRDEIAEGSTIGGDETPVNSGIPPRSGIGDVRARAQQMLAESGLGPRKGAPGGPEADTGGLDDLLGQTDQFLKSQQPKPGTFSEVRHAAGAGLAGMGAEAAGTGEYFANRLGLPEVEQPMHAGREWMQQQAAQQLAQLDPKSQDELGRSIFSLDPHKTIWQGGPGEVAHSLLMQVANSAPPVLATLLPGARLLKAGMTRGALTYIGATQAGLSVGAIANNISDEIKNTPDDQLQQQSPRFAQLLQGGMDAQAARAQLTSEAQGYAPLVGGLVTGAIAASAGRYLEPVLTGGEYGLAQRALRGAVSQGVQGGAFAGSEKVARDVAASTYDNRETGPSLAGTAEAFGQGASGGAILGAGFAATHGGTPRPRIASTGAPEAGVPEDHHTTGPDQMRQDPLGDAIAQTTQPGAPRWRGGDVEGAGNRGWGSGVQGTLDFGDNNSQTGVQEQRASKQVGGSSDMFNRDGIPQDQAAAIRGHFGGDEAGYIRDMFEQPNAAGPGGQDMSQVWARNEQLPLQGGQMNPTAGPTGTNPQAGPMLPSQNRGFTMEPTQRELPMRVPRDRPSAEPPTDLYAQMREMEAGRRPSVYLSADNIQNLQQAGLLNEFEGRGVPLVNFDGQGGAVIARDHAVAEQLHGLRDQGVPMEQILGQATGAGNGKPAPGPGARVVQLRDEQGNVIREGAVPDSHAAEMTRRQWQEEHAQQGGRGIAEVMTPEQVQERRAAQMTSHGPDTQQDAFRENLPMHPDDEAQMAQDRAARDTHRAMSLAAEQAGESGTPVADRAFGAAKEAGGRGEAAEAILNEARRLHGEEKQRAKFGTEEFPDPKDVTFEDTYKGGVDDKAAAKYEALYHEYAGTQVLKNTAETRGERIKAQKAQENASRKLITFLKIHEDAISTPAKRMAKLAVGTDKEAVRGALEREREAGGAKVEPRARINPEAFDEDPNVNARVSHMDPEELDNAFMEAARHAVSSDRAGRTLEEFVAKEGATPSEKRKAVKRYYRDLQEQAALGNTDKRTKTKPIAAGPIKPMSAEERARARAQRELARDQTLTASERRRLPAPATQPQLPGEALMRTVPPRRELEESQAKRETRAERAEALNGKLSKAIDRAEMSHRGLLRVKNFTTEDGTEVSAAAARGYMRQLLAYGRRLSETKLVSHDAQVAAEAYLKRMEAITSLSPKERARFLQETLAAEHRSQDVAAGIANPERPKGERPTIDELNAKRQQRIEAGQARPRRGADTSGREVISRGSEEQKPLETLDVKGKPALKIKFDPDVRSVDSPTAVMEAMRDAGVTIPTSVRRAVESSLVADSAKFTELLKHTESLGHDTLAFRSKGRVKAIDLQDAAVRAMDAERAARLAAEQARKQGETESLAPLPKGPVTIGDPRATGRDSISDRFNTGRAEDLELDTKGADEFRDTQTMVRQNDRAAQFVGRDLEEHGQARYQQVLSQMLRHLDENHPYTSILRALQSHGVDGDVRWGHPGEFRSDTVTGKVSFGANGGRMRLNRAYFENARAKNVNPSMMFVHTVAHEGVHLATTKALLEHPALRREVETLLRTVRDNVPANLRGRYGLTDPLEFVAEGFTNKHLQNAMEQIRLPGAAPSLWQRFTDFVRRAIGLKATDRSVSALDALMRKRGDLFSGDEYHGNEAALRAVHEAWGTRTAGGEMAHEMPLDPQSEQHVGNLLDRSMKTSEVDRDIRSRLSEKLGDANEAVRNAALAVTSPRQMLDAFSHYFQKADGTNPYREYWNTFFKRNADNNAMMEKVGQLSNRWSNLADRHGIDAMHGLSRLMHDATIYDIHPDIPVTAEANDHLISAEQKARHAQLKAEYDALDPELKQHYQTVKNYYANTQREAVNQIVVNALHGMLTKGEEAPMTAREFDAKYNAREVRRLGLDTVEGLKKEFGDKIDDASASVISKIGANIEKQNGPYFPLTRNGDYVVTANRPVETKTFADGKGAHEYVMAQRAKDPTLAVSRAPKAADGSVTVTVREREVRMAESKSQARQHQQDLVAKYGEDAVSAVQLRSDLFQPTANITTGSALDTIVSALRDNPAAQNAVKEFYLKSLAEQSFRKRELNRSNVRGVDVENQHRAFVQYGRSSSYYLSQLEHGRHLANAMGEIAKATKEYKEDRGISATRLGEIAHEIQRRDAITRDPQKVNEFAKAATEWTQFAMMTSVSHWFVRGSQPYMLTIPWLAARHGLGESTAAMGRAQKLVASPLVRETADSLGGLRTLFAKSNEGARVSAEKTYTVLDQVMDHIKTSGDKNAAQYVDMLHHLRDNGIIDMSMATELKDISQGRGDTKMGALKSRVLDASRAMLHLVEVNNRAMTAVAAYDLARGKGATHDAATEFAKEAVVVTHNDYSYGNAPRAFMAQQGVLGGARAAMTQFMRYPQHVYAMLVQSYVHALRGSSPEEKAVGYKTLGGILATHLAMAGVLGAAVQPIKWAIGLAAFAASASGATQQPFSFANAFTGEAYNRLVREATNEMFGSELGGVVAGGLPRALGADVSQRMSLGTIYFTRMKTDSNASIIGSLVESFGGAWLSQLENTADAFKAFSEGDIAKGVQKMSPHIIRDIVEATRAGNEGLTNNAGNVLIPAKDISAGELFARAIGIQPAAFADKMAEKATLDDVGRQLQERSKDIAHRYASAAPEDRQAILEEAREFTRAHPGFAVTSSALMKARAAKAEGDRQIQMLGAKMRGRAAAELQQYR